MERKYRAISGQENAYCRTCPSYRGDEATPTRTIAAWRSKTWAIDAMLRVYRTLSHDKSDLLVRNSRQARILHAEGTNHAPINAAEWPTYKKPPRIPVTAELVPSQCLQHHENLQK